MKWKDNFGQELNVGDIVEDTNRKIIGRIVKRYGLPVLRAMKRFNYDLLSYELIEVKGPEEAYEYSIIPRHSKLWYWSHSYILDHIEVLQKHGGEQHVR